MDPDDAFDVLEQKALGFTNLFRNSAMAASRRTRLPRNEASYGWPWTNPCRGSEKINQGRGLTLFAANHLQLNRSGPGFRTQSDLIAFASAPASDRPALILQLFNLLGISPMDTR